MSEKIDELRHALKCAEISLTGKAERIDILERVLSDWLDCADTPDEWMRCRNNAKIALDRSAHPREYLWKHVQQSAVEGMKEKLTDERIDYLLETYLPDWGTRKITGYDMAVALEAAQQSATEAMRDSIAEWVSAQRNDIPATGEEFAAAIRARPIAGVEHEEARLVSYAPDCSTCTLNINGVEMYFRWTYL